MKNICRINLRTLTLATLLATNLAGHASPQVSADTGASHLGDSPAQTAFSGSVAHASGGDDPTRYGFFTSSASFGALRTNALIATIPYNSTIYAGLGLSTASFRDDFLIDKAGLTGTTGTVKVRFTISGSLAVSTNGTPTYNAAMSNTFAQASYSFGVDLDSSDMAQQRERWDGSSSGTIFLGIPQEYTLNFTFGTTLENVTLRIRSTVAAAGERFTFASSSTADLWHLWDGFVEVRDSGNNLVSDYTFSSASGTDYTKAIPEPGTTTLLVLSGLAFNTLRARRRVS